MGAETWILPSCTASTREAGWVRTSSEDPSTSVPMIFFASSPLTTRTSPALSDCTWGSEASSRRAAPLVLTPRMDRVPACCSTTWTLGRYVTFADPEPVLAGSMVAEDDDWFFSVGGCLQAASRSAIERQVNQRLTVIDRRPVNPRFNELEGSCIPSTWHFRYM